MKIYEIWENIKNEPIDIKDMVLSALMAQLKVRFRQILSLEIFNLMIVHEDFEEGFISYHNLEYLSEKSWKKLGCDDQATLSQYKKLKYQVDKITIYDKNEYGYPQEQIELGVVFKEGYNINVDAEILKQIMDKVYESEYIDINNSTISTLSNDRNMSLLRFPSVGIG